MLLLECPICGRRELRGVRSIERLVHTDAGIVVTVTCRACGHRVPVLGTRIAARVQAARSFACPAGVSLA